MNTYTYSAKDNSFYPEQLKSDYKSAGTWPEDGVEVDEKEFLEFTAEPPAGKTRGVVDGMPGWVDVPAPDARQLVEQAEIERQRRINEANAITADWRTELALGILDDDDKAKLTAWMKYIKAVKAVDTSAAPDITWPEKPV